MTRLIGAVYLPLRLAYPSMILTVALVAAIGVVEDSSDRDRLRFSLTAEGSLNDGAAFPVVLLALGLLGVYDFRGGGWHWLAIDVLWAISILLHGISVTPLMSLYTRRKARRPR